MGGKLESAIKRASLSIKTTYSYINITPSHQLWSQLDHQKMMMEHVKVTCLNLLEAIDHNVN